MAIDPSRAEKLLSHLRNIVDHPLADDSLRIAVSATLAGTALQFAAATRALGANGLVLGAATTLRSQFEALVRGIWILHSASDTQVERLSDALSVESQQATKNIPTTHEMLASLEKVPHLANLLISLREFKDSSWTPLSSFVHAGIHAVFWTRYDHGQSGWRNRSASLGTVVSRLAVCSRLPPRRGGPVRSASGVC